MVLETVTRLPLLPATQPLVEVSFPGRGKGRFLVDSGAQYSWVDEDFATRLGLQRQPLGAVLADVRGNETVIEEGALLERVDLGEAVATSFRVPILVSTAEGVDGAIGEDLLRTLLVILDGRAGELVLAPRAAALDATLSTLYQSGGSAVTYEVDWSGGIPVITLPVAGCPGPVTFAVDTGFERMSLPPHVIETLGLPQVGQLDAAPDGSTEAVAIHAVPGLEIGKLTYKTEALRLAHASLGWGVLKDKVMILDNARDRLLLADLTRL